MKQYSPINQLCYAVKTLSVKKLLQIGSTHIMLAMKILNRTFVQGKALY